MSKNYDAELDDTLDADAIIEDSRKRIAELRKNKPANFQTRRMVQQISEPEHLTNMMLEDSTSKKKLTLVI